MSARAPTPCATDPEPVAADQVPSDIAAETSGRPVIGDGALWTLTSALTVPPVYDVEAKEWFLKLPWMRREPGPLTITGRRLDGAGRFEGRVPGGYTPTGFQPSGLHFSTGGCWKVTGHLGASDLSFSIRVPDAPATTARDMDDGASTEAALAKRPLVVPRVPDASECPVATPTRRIPGVAPAVVAGPVAAVSFTTGSGIEFVTEEKGRLAHKILWLVDASEQKPVIARGRRIDAKGPVRFRVRGRAEATLDLSNDVASTTPASWRDIPSLVLVREPGCYAIQVDGPGFQSVFVLRVRT